MKVITHINTPHRRMLTRFWLSKGVDVANNRLEIGPHPSFPHEGYDTVNVDFGDFQTPNDGCYYDDTKHVAEWGTDPLPMEDNRYNFILAAHVLEHVPWFKAEYALKEALRVLKPGGSIEIWVPNFQYLVERYQRKECGDKWRKHNLDDHPMTWLNGRLFTYGPAPNWHLAAYDFDYLNYRLFQAGFARVIQLDRLTERTFPQESHGPMEIGVQAWKAG
jgi:SAM-dependent methyltransferase